MKTIIHRADERGHADHGWLNAHHSFSFAGYYDPSRVHFGLLRVLNDDIIAGGTGFGRHPHDNMEIVTIPLEGALKHQDSTGGEGVIRKGEVQIMSAGSGIFHSEVNASATEAVNLFQIWVFPKERNIQPRYDQKMFEKEKRMNRLCTVVSPDKEDAEKDGALWINQDAFFSLGAFENATEVNYKMHRPGNGVYLMVVEGSAEVDGGQLGKRDAIGIWETGDVTVQVPANTELLFVEVPMR
jgi:hypothetical protein